eukprot:387212_1
MHPLVINDPIVIGLLSSTTVSTILLIVCLYCHKNVIMPNARHPAFELRRPYFVSYVIITISLIMFLRSVIALAFYHDLISTILFNQAFRFLSVFGEMLCLIQRMYFIGYDISQTKYKETKLLSKYLQRGNDTKQALHLMNQYAQRHIDQQASPSVPTHSRSLSKHLALYKNRTSNRHDQNIEFDANSASLIEKILYHNQYFGDMKMMTLAICLMLALFVFIPGFFVFYATDVFVLCLIITHILFIFYISYAHGKCVCKRMGDADLTHYDDHGIALELTIVLCIVCVSSVVFLTITSVVLLDEQIEFYLILMRVMILTISDVFIVITLIFVPSCAIKARHKKYNEGKIQSKKCRIDLKDVLSHHQSFYSFTKQLVHDYSIENLMFLIEMWQYKYYPETRSTSFLETETDQTETLARLKESLSNSILKPTAAVPVEFKVTKEVTEATETDTKNEDVEGLGPLFKMKINVLLNALQDTQSDVSMDESEHLKGDEDDPSVTDDTAEFDAYNPYIHHDLGPRQEEIDSYLDILSDLPWHRLPLSDSYRKYSDRYFCAVHIFNKYLSRSAFDSLNISEVSLTDIECTLRSLYEYKLRSFHIGIEMDETERKQLKFESNVSTTSTTTYSRQTTTNFDFFEDPEQSLSAADDDNKGPKKPPKIKIDDNAAAGPWSNPSSVTTKASDANTNPEIKRKQKLRETLGLKIHFTSNNMYLNAMNAPKIRNDGEFEEN